MKAKVISTLPEPQYLGIDVFRTRSSESTESVGHNRTKSGGSVTTPSKQQHMPSSPQRSTREKSWRTKDMDSIFRCSSSPPSEIPDMFSIKRTMAFDEDDWPGSWWIYVPGRCHAPSYLNCQVTEGSRWHPSSTILLWPQDVERWVSLAPLGEDRPTADAYSLWCEMSCTRMTMSRLLRNMDQFDFEGLIPPTLSLAIANV
jgi:hypothetical protein